MSAYADESPFSIDLVGAVRLFSFPSPFPVIPTLTRGRR